MAKKSAIEKNSRRRKLSKKYSGRRARLKAIARDKSKPMEERFAATLKLAELPRNSSGTRIRNRCEISGRPRGFYRKHRLSRIALRDLGSKGLIPGWSSRAGKEGGAMAMNDPLGDMIARIYNAQMRNKSKVSIPSSRLRVSVLDVLKAEGFIRGYAAVEHSNGRKELEVELKYFDGEPVIREIARVSKPGRRVYASVKALPRVNNGLGVAILSTPKGVMADHDARDHNVGGEILCTVF
jgi:small subunit ribosomal protein S8